MSVIHVFTGGGGKGTRYGERVVLKTHDGHKILGVSKVTINPLEAVQHALQQRVLDEIG